MRKFNTSAFGDTVDLDDPKTYDYLPNDSKSLRTLMLSEIGYFYCYTKFWHKDIFKNDKSGQVKRVKKLIKNFTKNENENFNNLEWYKEQIFIFQDEIENMC